jgi:protein gp37
MRIPLLLQTPAAVRFLSAEPLLGPMRLDMLNREPDAIDRKLPGFSTIEKFYLDALTGRNGIQWKDGYAETEGPHWPRLDWIIAGGESGPKARPMHPAWVRGLRDQCAAAGVAFFFKQWGEHAPVPVADPKALTRGGKMAFGKRRCSFHRIAGYALVRFGKKAAGRTLDGKLHDAMPDLSGEARKGVAG